MPGAGDGGAAAAQRLLAGDRAGLLPEHRPAGAHGVDRPAGAQPAPPDDLADHRRDPLSDERFAPNLTLTGSGFRADDDTVTAIVQPAAVRRRSRPTRLEIAADRPALPSARRRGRGVRARLGHQRRRRAGGPEHLAAYGLGSPFPEDSKLCAALSAFWPAVAPDAARTFRRTGTGRRSRRSPTRRSASSGTCRGTASPGPGSSTSDGADVVDYPSLDHTDYVANSLDGPVHPGADRHDPGAGVPGAGAGHGPRLRRPRRGHRPAVPRGGPGEGAAGRCSPSAAWTRPIRWPPRPAGQAGVAAHRPAVPGRGVPARPGAAASDRPRPPARHRRPAGRGCSWTRCTS